MRVRTNQAIDLEPTDGVDWKAIDSALRTIVHRRGALDALEAKWIREAVRVKIWREVGCVNIADYLERRLGYAPRTGYDRVRVAMALEELPKLAAALEAGFPHSAVRALTRVCTNDNEQRWLDEVRGKSVHEIENMVSGRRRGSDPEDPADPSLVGKTLPFEGIRPATEALVRDARRALQEERGPGEALSDDDVLAAFARMFLEGRSGERTKAPYQIAVGLCERCGCGWQESGGRKFALSKADTERACCDAQWIGRLDDGAPDRAAQDVPPSVRRMVHRRARGRCEIPGCRSTRCLEIHHIVARCLGGTHDPENLILVCDGCHAAHHRGLIAIAGTASNLSVRRKHEIAYDIVANDERAGDISAGSAEGEPSARVSTDSSDPRVTDDARHTPSAHMSAGASHPRATASADDDASLEPSAHVSTNAGHRFDAAVARSRKRDALAQQKARLESSAHVTSAGHAIETAVTRSAPNGDGHDPCAHVSTSSVLDAAVVRSGERDAPTSRTSNCEPSAHVSTNAGHTIDAAVMHPADCIAPTGDGHGHEPSAHVSTNAGRATDAAVMRSADRIAPTSDRHGLEPSAHVSTSGPPSGSTPSRFEQDRIRTQARMALVTLGYKSGEAGKAVDLAIRYGHDTLEALIREALRSCIRCS